MNYSEKFYYKVRQDLLQKRAGITKWSKVGQVLQNRAAQQARGFKVSLNSVDQTLL